MNRMASLLVALLCWTIQITPGHILRTIDGDTFILTAVRVWPGIAAVDERVRVLGVDTPELNQPKGPEAKAFTETWLAQGPIALRVCKRDAFGRLLGEITRDGVNLADALRAAGMAK